MYNAAKAYSIQLTSGEQYNLLNPVIALSLADFEMFENSDAVISRFVLKEKQRLADYPTNDLELMFVELPKFHKVLDELETLTDKWIYYLKTFSILESVPQTLGMVPEIQKAFEVANKAYLSREELSDLEKREIYIQDQRGAIQRAPRIGREQGREEGIREGQLSLIIRQLVRRVGEIPPDIQTRIRGLSFQQLENLGEAVLDFSSTSDLIIWLQAHL